MRDAAAEAEVFDPVEPEETGRIDIGQVRADDQRGIASPVFRLSPACPINAPTRLCVRLSIARE